MIVLLVLMLLVMVITAGEHCVAAAGDTGDTGGDSDSVSGGNDSVGDGVVVSTRLCYWC